MTMMTTTEADADAAIAATMTTDTAMFTLKSTRAASAADAASA